MAKTSPPVGTESIICPELYRVKPGTEVVLKSTAIKVHYQIEFTIGQLRYDLQQLYFIAAGIDIPESKLHNPVHR